MIYSTELANKVTLNTDNNKYLEAGIHENVRFVSARTAVSPTGKNFMEFRFEKDGKELLHTEWEPTNKEGSTDEQNQSKATNQVTRIMRILKCFYPKEVLNFNGNSYKEFSDWVLAMSNSANKNILLKVKVIYNDKGYTTLPSYVSYAFIEPMVLPEKFYEEGENKSMIKELSMDRFTKPIIADNDQKDPNPLSQIVTPVVNDDLPF